MTLGDLHNLLKREIQSSTDEIQRSIMEMKDELRKLGTEVSHAQVSSQLATIDRDLNYIQQEQLSNNMLLSNVIKTTDEDLCAIMCKISETLGVELFDRDIFAITRLSTRNAKQIEPILVQFSNRVVKEKLMTAAKNITLSCRSIGFSIDQRIYLNHHLTPKNQTLLQVVRAYKREHSYKFAWFNRGYIYIKNLN
ncbi:uncharacterized protein LOC129720601 [Wyeomyia smithii]|uniref:uncharacterized protein LOC129720601 n=1 Tax=Wyeomyia smithii TaxID=174621 RepID=UPI002467ECDE|nr:uncharacterized protein LOC129720601 [Wyeomyia smithii]